MEHWTSRHRQTLIASVLAVTLAAGLSACSTPSEERPTTLGVTTVRIADDINITCREFRALSPADQRAATHKLLNSYQNARELASEQADARRDHEGNQRQLAGNNPLEDPSFYTLAKNTCAIDANKDKRLLTAMGFSAPADKQ